MAYYETPSAFRRSRSTGKAVDNSILSVAFWLFLFAVFATALVLGDAPAPEPAPGEDWHGNVAASGYPR